MLNIFLALNVMSSKFPIGVEIIYKPLSKFFIILIFIFIGSCAPVNNVSVDKILTKNNSSNKVKIINEDKEKVKTKKNETLVPNNNNLINQIEVILPKFKNKKISKNLINSFELSIYQKKIKDISFNVNRYSDSEDLKNIIESKAQPGKIFIGTLSSEASRIVKSYCNKGILFFSFTSNKKLGNGCVYLINFFPEDDLTALFNYFPNNSKIALLYPENFYGYNINEIIDPIASKSNSLIINRASYKEDLTNARESIKELGKYELRKYELNRQKKILKNKKDSASKKALKKIERFETTGNVDFTHIILPDYSIRLLEIAPLLPFYDVDPKIVQFVGTGVWDDKVFFDEPSLQGAVFSGIEESKRKDFFDLYKYIYQETPIRTSTIPYDLTGIISYLLSNNFTVNEAKILLNSGKIKFDGLDGRFLFIDNIISRELQILKINNGKAEKLK